MRQKGIYKASRDEVFNSESPRTQSLLHDEGFLVIHAKSLDSGTIRVQP